MTPKKMMALIKEAKEMGLPEIRIGDVYVKFDSPAPIATAVPELKAEELIKAMSHFDMPTEDELKYYATPYYDELQRQKELRAQQIKDNPNGEA